MRDEIAFLVDFERAAPRYRQLPAPVRRILRLCDGTRGLKQVVALSPIDAERTEAVLRRLAQLGIITPRHKAAAASNDSSASQAAREPQEAKATKDGSHARESKDARPAAPTLGFTSDEEQFFDSPIDHLVADEFAE